MNDLERFRACMAYEPVDHCPFWTGWTWPETIERWKGEGFRPETDQPDAPCDGRIGIGHWFFPNPPFERKVIEETERHILYINHEGILMRERRDQPWSSMPQFVKFPVETRQEFREFWAQRMKPDPAVRIGPDWRERLAEMRKAPHPIIVISDRWGGFFGPLRNMLGVENLCMLFYDDTAFLEEMMDANADFIIAMMGHVLDAMDIDAFGFWEDMGYNHAPLISPEMARRFMLPRYRRVCDFLRGRGVKYIGLDSDGQIDSLIPVWMDAGLNFLYPFEVQAGMEVVAVRKKYGRELRLWGGLNKRAVAQGPAAIDAELARVAPLIAEGGYIPHMDHSAPPDISYPNYCYYMQALARACGR